MMARIIYTPSESSTLAPKDNNELLKDFKRQLHAYRYARPKDKSDQVLLDLAYDLFYVVERLRLSLYELEVKIGTRDENDFYLKQLERKLRNEAKEN